MENKRVTMKDVAVRCGVSTATVSYVLNYSKKEKISHKTRLEIFTIAKEMGYVPNLAARSLAGSKSKLVGVIININEYIKKSKIYYYYDIVNELQKQMSKLGYDVVLISTKEIEMDIQIISMRSLEAVFIIDADESSFKKISNKIYVPIILIDSIIKDNMFYRVVPNYEKAILIAKELLQSDNIYIIMEDFRNESIKNYILKSFKKENIFINGVDDHISSFLQHHTNKNGIVIGEILSLQIQKYLNDKTVVISSDNGDNITNFNNVIIISNKKKAEIASGLMLRLLDISSKEEEIHTLYVEPENL